MCIEGVSCIAKYGGIYNLLPLHEKTLSNPKNLKSHFCLDLNLIISFFLSTGNVGQCVYSERKGGVVVRSDKFSYTNHTETQTKKLQTEVNWFAHYRIFYQISGHDSGLSLHINGKNYISWSEYLNISKHLQVYLSKHLQVYEIRQE